MNSELKQFILDTLLPYKEDNSLCALFGGSVTQCAYLAPNGNKCAVGKHLKEGDWQHFKGDVVDLFFFYGEKRILTQEALELGIPVELWSAIQRYHDGIATDCGNYYIAASVSEIEKLTEEDFSELRF